MNMGTDLADLPTLEMDCIRKKMDYRSWMVCTMSTIQEYVRGSRPVVGIVEEKVDKCWVSLKAKTL